MVMSHQIVSRDLADMWTPGAGPTSPGPWYRIRLLAASWLVPISG